MVKQFIPTRLKSVLRRFLSCFTWDRWAVRSWSQEGEDLILNRIFWAKRSGFYIDVGAHHPKRFSNTFLFYKRGWRGINIDAMPSSMVAFRKARSRDINLEIGVGEEEKELNYYVFNEPALNGFSQELSQERHASDSSYFITEIIKLKVIPLSVLLDRYLPPGEKIDFMSVDVEGHDLQVLKSNDWSKYRPSYVLAENIGSSLHEIGQSETDLFMHDNGYVPFAKSVNTVFYRDASS